MVETFTHCDTCGLDADGFRDRCDSKTSPWHADGKCGSCWSDINRTAELGRCFVCHYWLIHIDDPEGRVVINGTHYRIGQETGGRYPTKGAGRGFGGQRHVIRFTDGREPAEVTTTNLWFQGPIPEHFRDRLPDNAVFARPTP